MKVKVRLTEPLFHTDSAGNLVPHTEHPSWRGEWSEVKYLEPDECEHMNTICRACLSDWEQDYTVLLGLA